MAVDAMESTETTQSAVAGEGSTTEPAFGPLVIESLHRPWWNTFFEEIEQIFRPPPPLPPPPQYRDALPGEPNLGSLMLEHLRRPWWTSIRSQTAELSELAKLPPLQVTSQPINLKSIWGGYDNKKRGLATSAAFHVLVIILIFTVFRSGAPEARAGSVTLIIPVDITPYMAQLRQSRNQDKQGGGGGGGANAPLPPSKGRLPRFSMEQLTPPTPVIKNENPQLAVEPTVVVPPDAQIPQIDMAMFGDPFGKVGPPSAGPGSGGGIGTGTGGGVGSGRGAGVGPGSGGGFGGGVFRVGGGVSAPRLTRKVEPEYSEEARKAKYQGTVTLAVEVWPDGKAHNIRVLRSLGLGLDEKAVDAVRQWEFVPGKKDGRPVKVQATIEVNFRLL